jgi:hypothetical protein
VSATGVPLPAVWNVRFACARTAVDVSVTAAAAMAIFFRILITVTSHDWLDGALCAFLQDQLWCDSVICK